MPDLGRVPPTDSLKGLPEVTPHSSSITGKESSHG